VKRFSLAALPLALLLATVNAHSVALAGRRPLAAPTPACSPFVTHVQRVGDDFITSGDYDGDGKADISIVRRDGRWLIDYADDLGYGGYDDNLEWPTENGRVIFKEPLPGYYDSDCMLDRGAIDTSGNWYVDYAFDGFGNWVKYDIVARQCPASPFRRQCLDQFTYVPADYDGDGAADLSVKTRGGVWYIDYAGNGHDQSQWDAAFPGFGGPEFVPVPADYDGDGHADFSTRDGDRWYVDFSSNGVGEPDWDAIYLGFGSPQNYVPVPEDYDGDTRADFASRDGDNWYIDWSSNGRGEINWDAIYHGFGSPKNYAPAPADYDNDTHVDLASHTATGDWLIDFWADGFGTWNQVWNSFAAVSGGAATTQDLRDFDVRWMSNPTRDRTWGFSCGFVQNQFDAGVWGTSETMSALARVYEVTHDRKYVDELERYASCVVLYRDDHRRPREPALPFDVIRKKSGLPGWGGRSLNSAGFYRVDEDASNLYTYSVARFARIVFEDDSLHAQYGKEAIDAVNTVLATPFIFLPQFDTRPDGLYAQGFLTSPLTLATAWTDADCDAEFQKEIAEIHASGRDPASAELDRMNQQLSNCKAANNGAGGRFPYNENGAYGLAMIELVRAINAPYYRESGQETETARLARGLFPLMVSRIERYFHHALVLDHGRYKWSYSEGDTCCEDASHAAFTMRFVEVLHENLQRLAPLTSEPILLDSTDMRRFANAFVYMTDKGNIADQVGGRTGHETNNQFCYSWVDLSPVDRRVYDRCHEMILRSNDGWQPALNASSHAALLANGVSSAGRPPALRRGHLAAPGHP
jgi:hypothetical protein